VIPDTSERWRLYFEIATIFVPGGGEEVLLGKLGSKLAAKLAAREGSLFLRASRAGYRLHGQIPDKGLLRKTASEGLVELRELTRTSIATREAEMLRLGAKGGHAARLSEERGLLQSINEILRGRKVP